MQLQSSSRGADATAEGATASGDPQDFSFAIVATIAPGRGAGPVKRQIPVVALVVPGLLILALVGYFLLIKPKQDAAGRLSDEIATLETQVEVAMAAQRQPQGDESAIEVADVFRVTKAMPDDDDMPGIILELNAVAAASGIEFVSIAPQAAAVRSGYTALPINLAFEGNYYDLTDFLFRAPQPRERARR